MKAALERHSGLPLYLQLKASLAAEIEAGRLAPGDPVPGDHALMGRFQVSRATVREAFRELERAGLVERFRGRGTFVSRPVLGHAPEPSYRLSDSLRAHGLEPGWRLLECRWDPAPREAASALGVAAGRPVCLLRRLRLAQGEPIGIHTARTAVLGPNALIPAKRAVGESLDYLVSASARSGLRQERIIEAVAAGEQEADLLEVEAGAPLLQVRRLTREAGGSPLEHLTALYRGDRFHYTARSSTGIDQID